MINVGIIGFGTVGCGTIRILLNNNDLIKSRTGADVTLKKIADLDIQKDRGIVIPNGVLTTNVNEILDDPDIDIVVELIGGIHPAKEFILKALQNGKHVVTANKALLATEGQELFQAAGKAGRALGFEAAVAGGIPIIKTLREGLASNHYQSIYGIINGTSNYILTKMTDEGKDFKDALSDAQSLGYAEANPAFDIEGIDTAHKLTLIASLCYGIPLSFNKIYVEGITKITAQDVQFATELGYKIKLLAIARQVGKEIELRVHPTMVPVDHLISNVNGVFNAIRVIGDAVGETLYYGRGAGDMPTGSAVVSDIIDIATGKANTSNNQIGASTNNGYTIRDINDIESLYYFRFTAMDSPGVLSRISGVLGENGISISAVIQKGRKAGGSVPLVVLTHNARERDVMRAVNQIDSLPVVSKPTMFIRVEGGD
ncbi:MAG: homoserine dehydrogenase [Nitrospirae bacterium]|nr:homoserine dehydrogenase [Nitrospirota bacterium]